MQALAVELRLLSDLGGPALRLTPGRGLMARVVANDGAGRGTLNIAGALLEAGLPPNLRPGDQVRLTVRHVDEQRVVLELGAGSAPTDPESTAAATQTALAPPPPAAAVPLPGGGTLRVSDQEHGGRAGGEPAGTGSRVVALRYDTAALGPLELRFELDARVLRVAVAATGGEALERIRGQSGELREALARASDRPVSLSLSARHDPLDLYA